MAEHLVIAELINEIEFILALYRSEAKDRPGYERWCITIAAALDAMSAAAALAIAVPLDYQVAVDITNADIAHFLDTLLGGQNLIDVIVEGRDLSARP